MVAIKDGNWFFSSVLILAIRLFIEFWFWHKALEGSDISNEIVIFKGLLYFSSFSHKMDA